MNFAKSIEYNQDFLERNDFWQKQKELAILKSKRELEEKQVKDCTFKPTITDVDQQNN